MKKIKFLFSLLLFFALYLDLDSFFLASIGIRPQTFIIVFKIVLAILSLVYLLSRRKNSIQKSIIQKLIIYFVFLAFLNFISSCLNGNLDLALLARRSFSILYMFCLFAILVVDYNKDDTFKSIKMMCAIILVISLIAYLYIPEVGRMYDRGNIYLRGIFDNRNSVVEIILPLLSLIFIEYVSEKKKKLINLILLVFCIGIVLLTGSITSCVIVLVCIVGSILGIIFKKKQKGLLTGFIVFTAILWGAFMVSIVNNSSFSFVSNFFDSRSSTLSGRTFIWQKALAAIEDAPLIGYGQDTTVLGYSLDENDAINTFHASSAHNSVMNILVTSGIIGLTATVVIIVYFIKDGYYLVQEKKEVYFIMIACIAIFIRGLTENAISYRNPFLGVFFLIIFMEYSRWHKEHEP